MDEMKKATILVESEKWERFKKIAKKKQSDASKEIRKFIDKYLAENSRLFLEMEAKRKSS